MKPAILAALLILSATPAYAYRSPWYWDLRRQERQAIDWKRHCRVMKRVAGWRPFGCR